MKTLLPTIAALLSIMSLPASAVADHQYAPVDTSQQQPFDVYTDGKNTYIEAVKGVVVRGATREGDSFVVRGMPDRFVVQFNGKSMVIARTGLFTQPPTVAIPPYEQSPVSAQDVPAGARLAAQYMQTYTGGAATLKWAQLATVPSAPSGARNIAMPGNWKVIVAADSTWLACTQMDEAAVGMIQQFATAGGVSLTPTVISNSNYIVVGSQADVAKANQCT